MSNWDIIWCGAGKLICFMFYAPLGNIRICEYNPPPPPDDDTFGEMTIRKNVRGLRKILSSASIQALGFEKMLSFPFLQLQPVGEAPSVAWCEVSLFCLLHISSKLFLLTYSSKPQKCECLGRWLPQKREIFIFWLAQEIFHAIYRGELWTWNLHVSCLFFGVPLNLEILSLL